MKKVCKDVFKAIHEGKWISIEYNNKSNELTKYWIGIKNIKLSDSVTLIVDGLHVGYGTIAELRIDLDKITFSSIIDGSYYPINDQLVEDIDNNPLKYQRLFDNVLNLKILNYLSDCNKLDNVPYRNEYTLVQYIDDDKVKHGDYSLDDEQYLKIIREFQKNTKDTNNKITVQLCLNILSINTKKGLYVLAYRSLNFDPLNKCFHPSEEIHVCNEFTVNDTSILSVRHFLSDEDLYLVENFMDNLSIIEDKIIEFGKGNYQVDDIPYLIGIQRECIVPLDDEYEAIIKMYRDDMVTTPIKAFFGELTKQSGRRKNYPITLLDKKTNLDQLLAIHNAIKYPITYVQGPPGTGKTNTIINTILTAFFNKKTVLFSSYNNHPIDSVFEKLSSIRFGSSVIPFPILRIGNNEKTIETINYVKKLYEESKNIVIYDNTLGKYENELENNSKKLTSLMQKYEDIIDLNERKEAVEKLIESSDDFNFQIDLQTKQLDEIKNKLASIGEVTNKQALDLVVEDEVFKKYLNYSSISYIKKLAEPKYSDFIDILYLDCEEEEKVTIFNRYLSKPDNVILLMKVFPIMATTCISAHKIGKPDVYFDTVIIDEASQCNSATSLIPILRGENLLLVGDPQQLNPVIQLDPKNNEVLKKKYNILDEYDYIKNSIYKTFLAVDSISQEILLSHHYRCEKKIINFCNKKYYHNKLVVNSMVNNPDSLQYVDIKQDESPGKNYAPREVEYVVDYCKRNPNKNIGIITPFANQKELIEKELKENKLDKVTCGTVHAFQGDEKDTIIFSLSLTNKTSPKTYDWLKNNKELINIGVSRAREKLVILSSKKELDRLHFSSGDARDDIYELVNYVKSNGESNISEVKSKSRALGIKPYSSETEEAFMMNLNHCLGNIIKQDKKCIVKKEVAIASIFENNPSYNDLFYTGRFDFVVFEKELGNEIPILAIELDGKEHHNDSKVISRDNKKNQICKEHGFDLIRIENSYARRYNYLKDILINYFSN